MLVNCGFDFRTPHELKTQREQGYLLFLNLKKIIMIYSDYQMFTTAGNKACESLVKKVVRKIKSQQKMTHELILEMCKIGCKKIAENYPEVYDSEPVHHISVCVNKALMLEGYNFKVDSYDFY